MSHLMSFRDGKTNIGICPCRSINIRECFPPLANFVDEIADWDFPDGDIARALAIKVLPSTKPYLIVQYRESMRSSRKFRDTNNPHRQYRNVITKVDTGVYTIRPSGPLGAIIVRLKPEAVAFLLGERLQCFADVKIDLGDVFAAHEINLLEEIVSEAQTSFERASAVAQFLYARACLCEPDPIICQAVAWLRSNPSLQVRRLAAKLNMCERNLSRKFQATFGVGPKQFARFARIEKVLAARSSGSDWADIAYGCGFADQAHMISDFTAVIGVSPERALLPAAAERRYEAEEPNTPPVSQSFVIW